MDYDKIVNILDDVHTTIDKIGWFDEGEKTYFAQQRGRYRFVLQYLSKQVKPGQALLDVGSHVLHFGMAASKLGYEVWGSDIKYFAEHPLNKLRQEYYGISEVRICDLSRDILPFDDQSFDVVIFAETLEHLNFNPMPSIIEFHRVLKPGGSLLITTPNAVRLGQRIRFLMGKNIFADLKELCLGDAYSVHYREYTLDEVTQLLEWGDFVVPIKEVRYLYPVTGMRRILKAGIEKLFPSLPGNLFVVGVK